ncbi:hypothetical protein HMPREF1316_1349 [Olsenella profusa F0195]|uniref:Uncharacterized protein n=1 Tax=Olsenella profusa F0195 TaxID=1125712 RepID=U2UTW9_9ACTN|nr:hypothetical protein HMPREF1316_1349 [Olsenella profusa F0195]
MGESHQGISQRGFHGGCDQPLQNLMTIPVTVSKSSSSAEGQGTTVA